MNSISERLNDALNTIGDILFEVAQEIVEELLSRAEFCPVSAKYKYKLRLRNTDIPEQKFISRGVKNSEFDFRNYFWITVIDIGDSNEHSSICLSFSDIDNDRDIEINSGNFHTQFGRLQFWRGLNLKDGTCSGPNELLDKNGRDIVLRFCGEKSHDPCQAIFDGTYEVKSLVDAFLAFMEKPC